MKRHFLKANQSASLAFLYSALLAGCSNGAILGGNVPKNIQARAEQQAQESQTRDSQSGAESSSAEDEAGGGSVEQGPSPLLERTYEKVVFPIEVLGATEATRSVTFEISDKFLSSERNVLLKIKANAVNQENKGSVRVNSGAEILLNNANALTKNEQKKFGGIGGAFDNLDLEISVPSKDLVAGKNKITFQFLKGSKESIGFRILSFNFMDGNEKLIDEELFYEKEDVQKWKPPLETAEDVAQGRLLWSGGGPALRRSPLEPNVKLRASCADCHATNGYDLKYFNFSNLSILERSKFHGLSDVQGLQIASYIRSQPFPNPGRPWNPPFQPGPGLDSKPINEWAAGAGVEWILQDPLDVEKYLLPSGKFPDNFSFNQTVNVRELPTATEFPTWNEWLPRIHPKDWHGKDWDTSNQAKVQQNVFNVLASNQDRREKIRSVLYFFEANVFAQLANIPKTDSNAWRALEPENKMLQQTANYSANQLLLVRAFEWHRTHDFDGLASEALDFNSNWFQKGIQQPGAAQFTNPRFFMSKAAFHAAPHVSGVDEKENPIRLGNKLMWDYFSNAWYQLQLVWTGNNMRNGDSHTHWNYVVPWSSNSGPYILLANFIKHGEAYQNTYPMEKFNPFSNSIHEKVYNGYHHLWVLTRSKDSPDLWYKVSDEKYRNAVEPVYRAYLDAVRFTPEQLEKYCFNCFIRDKPLWDPVAGKDNLDARALRLPSDKGIPAGNWSTYSHWNETMRNISKDLIEAKGNKALIERGLQFAEKMWPIDNERWAELRALNNANP